MIQHEFAERATEIWSRDKSIIGLAVAGSWLTNEIDEFSDLDLIVVTKEKITGDKAKMLGYAQQLDGFLSGFTGEHVGEPRVLICLYDNPLLHVDIKFFTLIEFHQRVETPVILFDTDGLLKSVIEQSESKFSLPDYQWIEDRFWIWVHYALLKLGRGEYLEALDFFAFLRMVVLSPLLHIKNGNLPKGVRKVETRLEPKDLNDLKSTIPIYTRQSLLDSLRNSVSLYHRLRIHLFNKDVRLQKETEQKVMAYFSKIESLPNKAEV